MERSCARFRDGHCPERRGLHPWRSAQRVRGSTTGHSSRFGRREKASGSWRFYPISGRMSFPAPACAWALGMVNGQAEPVRRRFTVGREAGRQVLAKEYATGTKWPATSCATAECQSTERSSWSLKPTKTLSVRDPALVTRRWPRQGKTLAFRSKAATLFSSGLEPKACCDRGRV